MYSDDMSRVIDVRQEQGSTTIVLRSFRAWEILTPLLGTLAGMFILLDSRPAPASPREPDILGGLTIWLIAVICGAALWVLVRLIASREEIVTASRQALVIERQVLLWPQWRSRRTYEADSVKNVRAYVDPVARQKRRFPPWLVSLAFDHKGSTVRFGAGLLGTDADRVVQALARAMNAPTQ
jgi:hypothetical protein